ncbi:MAG: hypothetical protein FJZ01_19540 [Candidatus Sericytochromatia bacterium]|nr:hypothetical protein [Candidatus Tanganyikabacteria bacterium]
MAALATRNLLLALCAAAALGVAANPASAQRMRTSVSPERPFGLSPEALHPIASDLGMPIDAGAVNILAVAGLTAGGLGSTILGMRAGLTDNVTLELAAPYLTPGGPGFFSGIAASGQIGLWQSANRDLGLSISAGAEVPGGAGGFNLTALQPILGLRGQAGIGPLQTHANFFARPVAGTVNWQLAGMWHVTDMGAPGLEFQGVAGAATTVSIIPEIKLRPIRNLALGVGYQIPLTGAQGQVLAQAELLF